MRSFGSKIITFLICLVSLFACSPKFPQMGPLTAGAVIDGGLFLGKYTVKSGSPPEAWRLSKMQLERLDSWLQSHRGDWTTILASPPLPSYSARISDTAGTEAQIDLFSLNESWKHAMHIYVWDKHGKFVFGGAMSMTAEDVAGFKRLLSKEG